MADYCRLNIGPFELENKDMKLDDIVKTWKGNGCPMWNDKEMMGFTLKDGFFRLDDYSHDLIEQWEQWDHIVDASQGLYGHRIRYFIQELIEKGDTASVTVECKNDSTNVETTFWYEITKERVEKIDEDWYNPDIDDEFW